jgi:hypothetical protein
MPRGGQRRWLTPCAPAAGLADLGHRPLPVPLHLAQPREVFGPDFVFLPREDLLTFEELTRLARVSRAWACANCG